MPFRDALASRFWGYAETRDEVLEGLDGQSGDKRPPVFTADSADLNVISAPTASSDEQTQLLGLIPADKRHIWFRSMNSSQALAQSVFGNLIVHNQLAVLEGIKTDAGEPLIEAPETAQLEFEVDYLGEPRKTSLDVIFRCANGYRVAFECKLTEQDIGACSRPALTPKDHNFEADYCDGSYSSQQGRDARCSLTQIGVRYWQYLPALFKWDAEGDLKPCPVHRNYQLVRNVLAACVAPSGQLAASSGHAVLIYDERNPAFQLKGDGYVAYERTRTALHDPTRLRRCSWQTMVAHLHRVKSIRWLADGLSAKYGF